MNNPEETQIVWRLSKADKGKYVAAARSHSPPLPLIAWLKQTCDDAATKAAPVAPEKDPGETRPETPFQGMVRELIEQIRKGLDLESGPSYLSEMATTNPQGKEFVEGIIKQIPERYVSYDTLAKLMKEQTEDSHEK